MAIGYWLGYLLLYGTLFGYEVTYNPNRNKWYVDLYQLEIPVNAIDFVLDDLSYKVGLLDYCCVTR